MPRKTNLSKTNKQSSNWMKEILLFPIKHPFLFLLIVLILFSGAIALAMRRETMLKLTTRDSRNSQADFLSRIRNRCEKQPFDVSNKLPGLRVDSIQDEFYPQRCALDYRKNGNFSKDCKQIIAKRNAFMQSDRIQSAKEIILRSRNEVEKQAEQEMQNHYRILEKIFEKLKPEQQERLTKIDKALNFLRKIQLMSNMAKKLGHGTCAEHTFSAIFDILKMAHDSHRKVLLTYITVATRRYKQSHDFLVVGGNHHDIEIINNRPLAVEFLKKLQGYICDPWNQMLFIRTSENQNAIYLEADSVMAETVNTAFDYQDLPSDVIENIEYRLDVLELGTRDYTQNTVSSLRQN